LIVSYVDNTAENNLGTLIGQLNDNDLPIGLTVIKIVSNTISSMPV